MTEPEIRASILANPFNGVLLHRLAALALPDCHLVARCLFQPVWNAVSGRDPAWGIKDYDVCYFDGADLSWEAEDRVVHRVAAATADLPVTVEVRNQARVHLWYRDRFGEDYPVLTSARAGIDRYLIRCTCVGIRVADDDLYAPDGFEDLVAGVLRLNPVDPRPTLFRQKAESYRARWPWLRIAD